MKAIITTVLILLAAYANAQTETSNTEIIEGTTITVTVPVNSDKGEIIAGLYNEATFMKAAPIQGVNGSIEDGTATVTFTNVTPGVYGITLFHDTNDNKTMDFEPSGMPKESYGVSNNVMNFGPPQWLDAKFEVTTEAIEMEIRM